MSLDFSLTQSPTTSEFFIRVALLLVAWVFILSFVRKISKLCAVTFWNHPVPLAAARIPSRLPHPNPPGGAVPFDIALLKASDDQIQAFMVFRGKLGLYRKEDDRALRQVADSAAEYKGLLYQERTMKWIDDHFRLHLSNLKYPYVDRHWNGWKSFWAETGPHIRDMFVSSVTVIFEHCANGLIFPGLYLLTRNLTYYHLALYGEIAYMIYATTLIFLSYARGKDVTIEQMDPAVWPMLLLHHISAMALCTICITIGANVPKDLVCGVLLALVGITSSLHYVGQILDFSPLAQSNAPYTRLWNHVFCLASQITFRFLYWSRLVWLSIAHCIEHHETGTTIFVILILFLFSLFNLDFIKFHLKATRGCWVKIQEEKIL